jgi:hypothetical protein
MTRLTLRQDGIESLALKANGSFGLSANARGHRREIDRRNRLG